MGRRDARLQRGRERHITKCETVVRPFGGAVEELVLRAAGLVGLRKEDERQQKCKRRKNYAPQVKAPVCGLHDKFDVLCRSQ